MKKSKKFRDIDLLVDVIDYAFVEWLVRRGLFSAFKSNYTRASLPEMSFRDHLRAHIRYSFASAIINPESLIASAFLFSATPEGANFWHKQSSDWRRFCTKLCRNH